MVLMLLLLRLIFATSKVTIPASPTPSVELEITELVVAVNSPAVTLMLPALPSDPSLARLSKLLASTLILPLLVAINSIFPALLVPDVLASIWEFLRLIDAASNSISPTKSLVSVSVKPSV